MNSCKEPLHVTNKRQSNLEVELVINETLQLEGFISLNVNTSLKLFLTSVFIDMRLHNRIVFLPYSHCVM